jgi:putative transposase
MRNNADYKAYMTYLNYALEIQSMIYTTNWIERLNRDFRRVTRMHTAMPSEESALTLMAVSPWNAYSGAYPFTFRQSIRA